MLRYQPDVHQLPRLALPRISALSRHLVGSADLEPGPRMLLALGATGHHVYAGTVPPDEVRRRRAAGKRQRAARRASRR